tara:strand:- start:16 stop:378 length:363 start_codon:yes stop_codon:yes gene_type:complete
VKAALVFILEEMLNTDRSMLILARDMGTLTLLSIAAFLPRIVMRGAHCIPEECIKIGADMKAKNHLAMGWGTVMLGDERNEDTLVRFKSGAKKLGIRNENVSIMKIGEARIIPSNLKKFN